MEPECRVVRDESAAGDARRNACRRCGAARFLRDLGIDAVWLMPHYPIGEVGRKGSLGSYYSIRDYRAVDPELGTLADFDAFVRRAHALGMKVLIDWVANHTSRVPAGSRNVRPTGTSGTLRAGRRS